LQLGPILAGLGIAGIAVGSRYVSQAWQRYQALPTKVTTRIIKGGFEKTMTRSEAAAILGVRYALFISIYPCMHACIQSQQGEY
jgi:hypothetical protein